MFIAVDTESLKTDGVITASQADEMIRRSRATMVALGVNALLCFGILAAAGGLVFWLADALAVAFSGAVLCGVGYGLLRRETVFSMLGVAATLVGVGMLMGGGFLELVRVLPDYAGAIAFATGAALAAGGLVHYRRAARLHFVIGAVAAMAVALHLAGLIRVLEHQDVTGLARSAANFYIFAALLGVGLILDVRLVTALSIAPFAQVLDTGTAYSHAPYVIFSPESTFSILQMALLIGVCLWLARGRPARINRHLGILSVLAFVVLNLCALVGSIYGDAPGSSYIGLDPDTFDNWRSYRDALQAVEAEMFQISENVYSVLWAIGLALTAFWAAYRVQRGLFNAALTFGVIHAYIQLYKICGDEPLAYVIGGFAAIGLAWGAWRFNHWLMARGKGINGP